MHPEELKALGALDYIYETIRYWRENDYGAKAKAAKENRRQREEIQKENIKSGKASRKKNLF